MPTLDPIFLKRVFQSLVLEKYKIEEKLHAVEEKLKEVKCGNALTYEHLQVIANREYWPFQDYWMWPSIEQLKGNLERTVGWFARLPNNEEQIVQKLYNIFKNISLVSIVLRFSVPEYYGIYSRPPLYIMNVERGKTESEEYLNYTKDLRLIAKSLGVLKTAEADMFVWAISYKPNLLTEFNKKLAEHLPKNISLKMLISCLQSDPLKIARVFNRKGDYQTSGFWAAKAFERFLEDECRKYPVEISPVPEKRHEKIYKLISVIPKWKSTDNANLLRKTKDEFRNRIIPGVGKFSQDDVNGFLKCLERLRQISMNG